MARLSIIALLVLVTFVVSDAFVSPKARWASAAIHTKRQARSLTTPVAARVRSMTVRTAATSEDDDATTPTRTTPAEPAKAAVPEDLDYYSGLIGEQPGADKAPTSGKEEAVTTSDYPIPLPSYLLLVLATVVSIAFTGSIFEVTGGHPELGYTATYIIGTLSLPTFIFLFYAAIKKGQAEVEEDDAKFGKGRW
ncbi:unnamed protein product [Ectocarpus sp. CCAP 1310/34]|nr:unnamed protein product [Ectocarpus sp. CCAP 1310/34]